jgi:phage-related baseplate assembly protein
VAAIAVVFVAECLVLVARLAIGFDVLSARTGDAAAPAAELISDVTISFLAIAKYRLLIRNFSLRDQSS